MYFVTAICHKEHDPDQPHLKNESRCFGYFQTSEEAIRAADDNLGDMHERLYNYLIIEEIPWGIFATVKSELWYHWNYETGHWDARFKPDFSKQIINWSIG